MFELDKYADTVLTAYAVSILLLGVLVWTTLSKSKKIKNALNSQENKSNEKHKTTLSYPTLHFFYFSDYYVYRAW
jgi:heme exporter protein CcmD